jgi:hypothetical protein
MQQPPPQQTFSAPNIRRMSSEFCEISIVEARRFRGVTSLDSVCSSSVAWSPTDGSVMVVEASESLLYSDAAELVESRGDSVLFESDGEYLVKVIGSSGTGSLGWEVEVLGNE